MIKENYKCLDILPQNPVPHSALSHSLDTSQIQVFPEHISVSLSQVFGHSPPQKPVPQSASLHSFATSQTHVFPEHTSVAPHVEGHSFPQAPIPQETPSHSVDSSQPPC